MLSRKLFELEEGGATALGPAVTVAIACAKSSIGSRVVICTDGLANVGIGNLEGADQDEAIAQAAQNTYNQLVSEMLCTFFLLPFPSLSLYMIFFFFD